VGIVYIVKKVGGDMEHIVELNEAKRRGK